MQRDPKTHSREFGQHSGDRHSITQQVVGGIMDAVRHGSRIQAMVNRYHKN